MAETNLSYEQIQELMVKAIGAAATSARQMNPLEQKAFDEEQKKQKRRAMLSIELANVEQERRWRQQNGCSHSRHSMASGTRAGQTAPRGQGEWTTGGQVHVHNDEHGNAFDTIGLICVRCGTSWVFKATRQEVEYANNVGLLGFPPPPIERCLNKDQFVPPPKPTAERMKELAQAGA